MRLAVRIKDWPEAERPREKLLARGPEALSDAELIAVLFGSGTRGQTAVDLARALLTRFGGLRELLRARPAAEAARCGLGPARLALLKAALELGRRDLEAAIQRGRLLSCPADTKDFLRARLRDHEREVFACLFLDNRHHVISFEEMFFGTIDCTTVHPREIVKRSLILNAAAVIAAHNHPSGAAEPSRADETLTHRLKEALALVEVRLIDHVVVGDLTTTSLAERGCL